MASIGNYKSWLIFFTFADAISQNNDQLMRSKKVGLNPVLRKITYFASEKNSKSGSRGNPSDNHVGQSEKFV